MSLPILATKLYIPTVRPNLVPRLRLVRLLNEGLHRKLTLLSAPAGFGKTTLLSEWIPTSPRCVAWLSLDREDNDPTRFWAYFIASLQGLRSDIGEAALTLLHSPQATPITSILTTLINDISTFPDAFAIVLDDYHVIGAKPIDNAFNFLIKNLPPQMHLVIATREDPNLPLARLRARGQLTELRAADLRFTPGEVSIFLNNVMGLGLSAEEITSLETRTEGWIAGLQLAAISMRGREDVHGFIRAFAGDNRYIVDYLVEEVMLHQPEDVQSFLLQTSILDRLSGPLCDAVTGKEQSTELLEVLERGNLFVVPLDDQRRWFRYHHLFADVLQAHLMEQQPDQIPSLHRRAGEWYEQQGRLSDAIRHALAAGDLEWAAGLIELAWPAMESNRQHARWLGWVKLLPDKLVCSRPVLSVGYAWALLDQGKLEAGEERLQDAERWLDTTADKTRQLKAPSAKMIVVDKEEFQVLPGTIAAARAYHALALGDVPGTLKYARRALDLIPTGDHLRRGTPAALLGLAYWASGDLKAAEEYLVEAMASYQTAGNILFAITAAFVLAEIRTTLGRLRQAFETYQQSLQLAAGQDKTVVWGTADLYSGLSELLREQSDLEAATEHLLKSKKLGEQFSFPRWRFRWCLAQARVKESQRDFDKALYLLDEAERTYVRGPVPDVRPIPALKTRVWIKQGRLAEALHWVNEQGLSVDDNLSFLHEFELITLARLLIAQYRFDRTDLSILAGMRLLDRLIKEAEEGGRLGSVIEMLVLRALVFEAKGDIPSALEQMRQALALSEPEGYIRIFVDEGAPMAQLLSAAVAQGIMPDYTAKLLAKYQEDERNFEETSRSPSIKPLIEPLSQRELEVLRLVAQGFSNQEIGDRLFLALPTVKGYTRTIFNKLQVHRRTEAVARAQELGLL